MENTHQPIDYFRDRIAWNITKLIRLGLRLTLKKHPLAQVIALESITGGLSLISANFVHLRSIRKRKNGSHLINTLIQETDTKRMHLLTLMSLIKMNWIKLFFILIIQVMFDLFYGLLYLLSYKMAHRLMGYLEEILVDSYSHYLEKINTYQIDNQALPDFAKRHWHLAEEATLSDGLLMFREDELKHKTFNHLLADN